VTEDDAPAPRDPPQFYRDQFGVVHERANQRYPTLFRCEKNRRREELEPLSMLEVDTVVTCLECIAG